MNLENFALRAFVETIADGKYIDGDPMDLKALAGKLLVELGLWEHL